MSAICAVFRLDGAPVPVARIQRLLTAVEEYGPEAGLWAPERPETPAALGCRPWRVTPEDRHYRPPLTSRDGAVVLVADARIDNRSELAAALGVSAGEAAGLPDAAFILAAWEAWGPDAVRRLIGDFAFALWDQGRRTLYAARDGTGQRVLFYQSSPTEVALATTAHALAVTREASARLDLQKVAEFLVLLPGQGTTFFEGIRRLPPGHMLSAGSDGFRLAPFWSPVPERRLVLGSDRDYEEGFLEVFGAAVRAQLRVAGPAGIMASGGLDSSSVAAMAASQLREHGGRLPLYHAAPRAGFEGAARRGLVVDESPEVEALARLHPNIELNIRRPDGRTPFDGLEASFRMTGAPPRNPANVGWFDGIYAAAQSEGIRVLLAGHRGNATISYTGLRSLPEAVRRGHLVHAWREAMAFARATRGSRRDVLWYRVVAPLLPRAVGVLIRRLSGGSDAATWDIASSPIHPEFARRIGIAGRLRAARLDLIEVHRLRELEYRVKALYGGLDAADIYSGFRPWFGIETRDPTADRRVVEFCFAIPGSQYLQRGVTRSLVRRAMTGLLPDQIRTRPTIGAQAADWSEWLPGLRPLLDAELTLLERSETARQCLDLARLRGLLARWPERLGVEHERDYSLMLLRGITMGRFIRWFETTYATP